MRLQLNVLEPLPEDWSRSEFIKISDIKSCTVLLIE
jgi:hypothetical protein